MIFISNAYRWIKSLIYNKSWTTKFAGVLLLIGLIIIVIIIFFFILIFVFLMVSGIVAFLDAFLGKK